MLTATYSQVAIINEQNSMRRALHSLQQYIQNAWDGMLHHVDVDRIEHAFNTLTEIDGYCRNRKVEQHLIPAIRRPTNEADDLLAELDAISTVGVNLLHSIGDQLRHAIDAGEARLQDVCKSLEQYCGKLLKRLAKEENELFPIAHRVLSVDEWFGIAEKFLSADGQTYGGRLSSQPPPILEVDAAAAHACVANRAASTSSSLQPRI